MVYQLRARVYDNYIYFSPPLKWFLIYLGNTSYTGCNLDIPIHFIDRSHGWSTTKFKEKIFEEVWDKCKKS